ncbi:MAG: ORF6N domain-containing protein [Paraprevotella sp.]|nr:ORF6N domain-containing protein [Paraprevotella sp.]
MSIDQVKSHIYSIRGTEVMLDRELAQLYGVETKVLNQAVKRNIQRFPERFMFQVSPEEWDSLKSQIVTSNKGRGGDRYLPYVFTEQGVTQLSTILRSKTAIEVSIRIMDAFVAMRRFLSTNAGMFQRIEKVEQHQMLTDKKVELVLKRMDELAPRVTPEQIFATGCVWDAWSYISDLIRSANARVVLIDNFVDDRVLTLLDKRNDAVSATIYSRYTEQFRLDLAKHNEQYNPITFIQLPHKSHDRFLIIDEDVYLMGASVKDMGTSLCAITKMEIAPETVLSLLK